MEANTVTTCIPAESSMPVHGISIEVSCPITELTTIDITSDCHQVKKTT